MFGTELPVTCVLFREKLEFLRIRLCTKERHVLMADETWRSNKHACLEQKERPRRRLEPIWKLINGIAFFFFKNIDIYSNQIPWRSDIV